MNRRAKFSGRSATQTRWSLCDASLVVAPRREAQRCPSNLILLPRNPHDESGAAAGRIVDRDGAAVRFHDRLHHAETKSKPALRTTGIAAVQPAKYGLAFSHGH